MVSRGPLAALDRPIDFRRYPASGRAAALVRHYWLVEYGFPPEGGTDVPILVYPACNLVIEHDKARLYAPSPRLAVQHLEGAGIAFGVLLQVATGSRLAARPVDEFVGDSIAIGENPAVARVRALMQGPGDAATRHAAAIAAFEDWLAQPVPSLTDDDLLMNEVAAAVEADSTLMRVDELAARFGLTTRRLERLVARYVGLTPKWMIQRRRLQEAAARLRSEPATELSTLAAELGYADYAHFSRDFAATVGPTPREFAAAARAE
ncbi:helix-turn-helix domain-containing protein [Gryllotalpicola daejeonensis]|uniref:Helix-turn-helix domain-containing protein n=1 Tax=Gryllotalpicola daejeonensis TaxID=993087 RepID=A0ABP7ZG49_9MICO